MDYVCAPYDTSVAANPVRANGLIFSLHPNPIYVPLHNTKSLDLYTEVMGVTSSDTEIANSTLEQVPTTLNRSRAPTDYGLDSFPPPGNNVALVSAVENQTIPPSDQSDTLHPIEIPSAPSAPSAPPAKDMVGAGITLEALSHEVNEKKQRKKEKLLEKARILDSFTHFRKLTSSEMEEKLKEMKEQKTKKPKKKKIKKETEKLEGAGASATQFTLRFRK